MTKFKTAVLVLAGVLGLAMVASPAASQATSENTDNSTVTVDVSAKTAIDISPDTLAYDSVLPGGVENTTVDNFTSVELENIGSTNITNVWFNASTPSDSPFGTGVRSEYNAGNFIQIRPEENRPEIGVNTDSDFTFVNRKEFSTDNIPEYIFRPGESWQIGRFRVADQEYFWAAEQASPTTCATNSGSFRVGTNAHNLTATGSNDFTAESDYTSYQPMNQSDAGDAVVTSVNISGSDYRVKIDCSANTAPGNVTVTRSKYNVNLGANDLSDITRDAGSYVLTNQSVGSDDQLQPGEHFAVDTRVSVPQGVAQGGVNAGTLRVLVNTQ